jgi:hypothetical protein
MGYGITFGISACGMEHAMSEYHVIIEHSTLSSICKSTYSKLSCYKKEEKKKRTTKKKIQSWRSTVETDNKNQCGNILLEQTGSGLILGFRVNSC